MIFLIGTVWKKYKNLEVPKKKTLEMQEKSIFV